MVFRKRFNIITIKIWILTLLFQTFGMPLANALTSGPSQPEFNSMSPIGSSDMVDLFTGDFSYNIPLMDVGGYPINLGYQSDIAPEEEASWVGLGWTLNPGSISRSVRGIPDDFMGDQIERDLNIKDDVTTGVSVSPELEVVGFSSFGIHTSFYHNTYRGFGTSVGISAANELGKLLSVGFSLSGDSQNGSNFSGNYGLDIKGLSSKEDAHFFKIGVSSGISSREGLKSLSMNTSWGEKQTGKEEDKNWKDNGFTSFGLLSNGFSYTPMAEIPFSNSSVLFRATAGSEVTFVHPGTQINGYRSVQKLATNHISSPAYGTLYTQKSNGIENAITDYNRENYGVYRQGMPNLPPVVGTYDYFSASAVGLNMSFYINRGDVGIFHPSQRKNTDVGRSLGLEFGAGNGAHVGVDVSPNVNFSSRGNWENGNLLRNNLIFQEPENASEKAYFTVFGEHTSLDHSFYDQVHKDKIIQVDLTKGNSATVALNRWNIENSTTESITAPVSRNERQKRNTSISYLTAEEASVSGLDKTINIYEENTLNPMDALSRVTDIREAHHISEITVTQPDGTRYVYGIPIYNKHQEDVTFSVEKGISSIIVPSSSNYSLVEYTSSENRLGNQHGKDNYYEKNKTPPFAYGYLLTAILSPDYEDQTGDGVSDDDTGVATKFNYSRISDSYEWRSVVANKALSEGKEGVAKYIEGDRNHANSSMNEEDDKASFTNGTKELWYLNSIESRTMLAQFIIESRLDGLGVDVNGIVHAENDNGQQLKQLNEIHLYSKSELNTQEIPIPLKSVHFEYDNSLCPNTPNSVSVEKGKLSLRKLWFTYGDSEAGSLNPYGFSYKTDINENQANFKQGWVNRWGYYQENPSTYPNNIDFPYALQDEVLVQQQTALWNLNEINLPSGGKIQVNYESDDYAFVQNKRAGRMFFIYGFLSQEELDMSLAKSNQLYYNKGRVLREYMIIDVSDANLPVGISDFSSLSNLELRKLFFEDVNQIYFKCLVDLNNEFKFNYITGYASYDPTSIAVYDSDKIIVRINSVSGDTNTHPITQAGFQKLRLETPDLIYPPVSNDPNTDIGEVLRAIFSAVGSIGELFRNFDKHGMRKGWSNTVNCNKGSMVRLAESSFNKFGGGSRVNRLEIFDNWNDGSSNSESSYGQTYKYETSENINGENIKVSSGVAAWEPLIGGEENLWREPVVFEDKKYLAPNNFYYTEKPYIESLFPSPIIGYSNVKVESINNIFTSRTSTGYTSHDFYTSKDFPTIVHLSEKQEIPIRALPISTPILSVASEKLAASQGYVIESNDMHGKAKTVTTFDAEGAIVEKTQYIYQVENPDAEALQLKNVVEVVKKNRTIESKEIGTEISIWQEMTENQAFSSTAGVEFNLDFNGFPPAFALTAYPSIGLSENQLRTSVTTKHIRKYGVLENVIVTRNGSRLESKNLLYDDETGQVLLSSTQNEFEDPVYTWNFPAYWAYDGMGSAYKNIRSEVKGVLFTPEASVLPIDQNQEALWKPGDEVLLRNQATGIFESGRFILYYENFENIDKWFLLDEGGHIHTDITNPVDVLVIRSGSRNQIQASMQSILLLEDPIETTDTGRRLRNVGSLNVIQGSATDFSDRWAFNCPIDTNNILFPPITNYFLSGISGHWRPNRQWTFYNHNLREFNATESTSAIPSVNQKNSGETVFSAFWQFDEDGELWVNPYANGNNPNWINTEEITFYDHLGSPVESKDALNIYSAVQQGYNSTLAVGVVANAELKEIGFENFEDYFFDNSNNQWSSTRHFYFLSPNYQESDRDLLTNTVAHSGVYSLNLGSPKTVTYRVDGTNCDENIAPFVPGLNIEEELNCSYCVPKFSPYSGKRYYFSAWVAELNTLNCSTNLKASIQISFADSDGMKIDEFTLIQETNPVDGWVRLTKSFEIPEDAATISITLQNNILSKTYFDDIRFYPEEAAGKAFVYDPSSLRLAAELDDNNYATFYEYDDAGLLKRVKRETERGVVTIQEGASSLKPNYE